MTRGTRPSQGVGMRYAARYAACRYAVRYEGMRYVARNEGSQYAARYLALARYAL